MYGNLSKYVRLSDWLGFARGRRRHRTDIYSGQAPQLDGPVCQGRHSQRTARFFNIPNWLRWPKVLGEIQYVLQGSFGPEVFGVG